MTAVRLRRVRLGDLKFREYEVWHDGVEPESLKALDAVSAAESIHRGRDEKTFEYTEGPTDWKVKDKDNLQMVTVRVTGRAVAEYCGVALGGGEKPVRSRDE